MLCYSCALDGHEEPAVALCRSCTAGLCLDHLHETASRFAASRILETCHHDTWATSEHRSKPLQHPLSRSRG